MVPIMFQQSKTSISLTFQPITDILTKQSFALQATYLQGVSMYAPQGPPAVFSSVLALSVIVIAAVPGHLPPLGLPALGLSLHALADTYVIPLA